MPSKPVFAILIGPFPGPLHGVSVINAKLAERMTAQGLAVERIDLSPGTTRRGLAYHATRAARTLSGFFRLLGAPLRGRGRAIMSVDGGIGLLYNIALAMALRLTGQALLLYHHSTRYVLADSALLRALLAVAGPKVPHIFCSEKIGDAFRRALWGERRCHDREQRRLDRSAGSRSGLWGRIAPGLSQCADARKRVGSGHRSLAQYPCARVERGTCSGRRDRGCTAGVLVRQAQAEFGPALTWCGVLAGDDKAAYYGGLDVFLFPPFIRTKPSPWWSLRPLAAGTPVIAYDHRFVGEILGPGGLLVPVTEAFAERAAGWIAAGQGEWPARRMAAPAAVRDGGGDCGRPGRPADRLGRGITGAGPMLGLYPRSLPDTLMPAHPLPKVSIVTVNFNMVDHIGATLDSVLEQDYPEFESIVIDGNSTDGSCEIIASYASRLTYWVSEPDRNLYDGMNKGVSAATGNGSCS